MASPAERRLAASAVVAQFALMGVLAVPARRDRPRSARLAGRAVSAAGVLGIALSGRALGSALTPSPIPVGDAVLRTDGPYAYVRHPIYAALLLAAAGRAVSCGAGRAWAAVALAVLIDRKAGWEERLLTQRFPEYAAYARRTPRLVPRPPRRG